MKRILTVTLAFALIAAAGWAVDLNAAELESVGKPDIVFENYTGAHNVFDTAEEIVGIGRALAVGLAQDGRRGDFYGLYSVIRAVDPAEKTRLDADLIVLGPTAGVDHINNVRRIITGYLQTAFGYARADAELLAVFATYYSAVYRGKIPELRVRYSDAVMANITAENAGIALRYSEWPGKTRLILPLARGGVAVVPGLGGAPAGAVSSTELTDKKVIEQLQTEPDKGLPERKAVTELKVREVETAKAAIAVEEKKLEAAKVELAKREAAPQPATAQPSATQPSATPPSATSPAPSAAATTPAAATPAPAAAAATPAPAAATPGAATAEKQPPSEAAVAEEKARIAEEAKKIEAAKAAVAAKEAEIAKDREAIVTDEKTTPAASPVESTAKPAVSETVIYLAGRGSSGGGRLEVIDPTKRVVSVSSPMGGITGLDFSYFKDKIVVVARDGGAARLVLLDPTTLAVIARSADAIFEQSYVHSQAGAIYAVSMQGGTARLGRYDESLARTALSAEAVDRSTYVRIFGDEVFVSAPDGALLILSAEDLSLRGKVSG